MKSKSGARLNRRTMCTLRGEKPRSAPPKIVAGPKSRRPEGRASSEVRTWSARAKLGGVRTSAQNVRSAASATRRDDVKRQLLMVATPRSREHGIGCRLPPGRSRNAIFQQTQY